MRILLAPLALLFWLIVGLRNWLYDRGWLKAQRLSLRTISIGNLTVGGTGKTPLTSYLLVRAQQRGLRAASVSRGYKSASEGEVSRLTVLEAELPQSAQKYGDEPAWLAWKHPQTPVYIGRDRLKAGNKVLSENSLDLILFDDAFQHRRLARDVDVLLIDACEEPENLRLLPVGRAREPWSSLKRSDLIVLTKTNLTTPEKVQKWQDRILATDPEKQELIFKFEHRLARVKNIKNEKIANVAAWRQSKVALVCGLARPESFRRLLERELAVVVSRNYIFPDHHTYQESDIDRILSECQSSEITHILTTEKDMVKLKQWQGKLEKFWVAELMVHLAPSDLHKMDRLDELVCGRSF